MSDPMTMKWAIVDLIRVLDTAYGGQLHTELARIARTLGVELPERKMIVVDDPVPPTMEWNRAKEAAAKKAARSTS